MDMGRGVYKVRCIESHVLPFGPHIALRLSAFTACFKLAGVLLCTHCNLMYLSLAWTMSVNRPFLWPEKLQEMYPLI